MAKARICDMCGCVIDSERDAPPNGGYTITMQRTHFLKVESIVVDLCPNCLKQIKEISGKGVADHE